MKAQVQAKTMLLILAAVVGILILFLGYNMIEGVNLGFEDAKIISLESKIKETIASIALNPGVIKVVKFTIPQSFEELCFADINKKDELLQSNNLPILVQDSLETGSNANVFLIKGGEFHSFNAGPIAVANFPHFTCYQSQNNAIIASFKGTGDSTEINEEFRVEVNIIEGEETILESLDGTVEVIISENTVITLNGEEINSISLEPVNNPNQDTSLMFFSEVYDFQPSGAMFNPPIVITINYGEIDLPPGLSEEDLVIFYFDGESWIALDTFVDQDNNLLIVNINHFTEFVIAAETSKIISDISSNKSEETEDAYLVNEDKDFNWLIIALIVLIVLSLVFFYIAFRKR